MPRSRSSERQGKPPEAARRAQPGRAAQSGDSGRDWRSRTQHQERTRARARQRLPPAGAVRGVRRQSRAPKHAGAVRRRAPASAPAAYGAQRPHDLLLPDLGHLGDPGQDRLVGHDASVPQPAAEQHDVDVDTVALLQLQASRLDALRAIQLDGIVPERIDRPVHGVPEPSRGADRTPRPTGRGRAGSPGRSESGSDSRRTAPWPRSWRESARRRTAHPDA